MIKQITFFLLLALPVLVQAQPCDCEPPASNNEALEAATYAFVGKCVLLNTNWMSGGMKYSFEVEKSWKKAAPRLIIVNSPFIQECGGMKFEVGKRYLVFVEKKFSHKTNRCMGSKAVVEEEVAALGEGMAPQPSKMVMPMIWTISILAVIFLALVIFVATKKKTKPS